MREQFLRFLKEYGQQLRIEIVPYRCEHLGSHAYRLCLQQFCFGGILGHWRV